MKSLTRWVVYDEYREIGWAFSEAGARQIAYEYELQCMSSDDSRYPIVWISEETSDNNL